MNIIATGEKSILCLEDAIYPVADNYFNLQGIYTHCLEGTIMVFQKGQIPWNKGNNQTVCRECKVNLEVGVNWNPAYRPEHNYICRNCAAIRKQKYKDSNPKYRQHMREYYQENKEHICRINKELRNQLREIVLIHYSENPPKCACCGETIKEFLSIDHITGGGAKHRKSIGGSAYLNRWLIKNNFPMGYQVLCHNCNQAKGIYGYCPHEKLKEGESNMNENINVVS